MLLQVLAGSGETKLASMWVVTVLQKKIRGAELVSACMSQQCQAVAKRLTTDRAA